MKSEHHKQQKHKSRSHVSKDQYEEYPYYPSLREQHYDRHTNKHQRTNNKLAHYQKKEQNCDTFESIFSDTPKVDEVEQCRIKLRRMVETQAAQLMYETSDIEHFTSQRKNLYQFTTIQERYEIFKLLLLPLENIQGNPQYHPEGDMLYHSLQVMELAKKGHGYDLEFLQAALLHDVGKAIDPVHHAEAGADALEGFVSDRVLFLVQYHSAALSYNNGNLGHRVLVFIKNHECFDDLMELRELDDQGRLPGMEVDTLEQSLDYLYKLEKHCF